MTDPMTDSTPDTAAPRTVRYEPVSWEVWADGEQLRRTKGFSSWEEAVGYTEHLSDEWRSVEVVMVVRTVIRVR